MKPENYRIIYLDEVDSTSRYLADIASDVNHATAVSARCQSAGRGQRGNTWESEPGANVTLSILLRPTSLGAANQFLLSQIVALAVAGTVDAFLPDDAPRAQVKWPNDVYVGDCKIAGILIENTLTGSVIGRSIAGIGLNVNQMTFVSDAPNPVSLAQIARHGFDRDAVEQLLCRNIMQLYDASIDDPAGQQRLREAYAGRLWRGVGQHPFYDALRGERIEASIESIAPTGHLTLRLADGTARTYAFKEVAFVIDAPRQ